LAEGIDQAARAELCRLEQLGCLGPNVVLVHGVAIDAAAWLRVAASGAGLVWCPASNVFLFDQTAPVRTFLDSTIGGRRGQIALGTDSRLSGSRDLLDELRIAAGAATISAAELLAMVTDVGAALLRQPAAGRIRTGGPADLLVIPRLAGDPARALLVTARRDVALVTVGGRPLIGDPSMAALFGARSARTRAVVVDGVAKIAHAALARRISACPITEPGVEAA
jgi:cytosine/adenosine deaminase-related metal-dependent hydrolase